MNREKSNLETNPSLEWIDELYREHGTFIESILRFAAADLNEREDIYQDIFMALIKKNDLSAIRDIRDYLYVLTINKVNEYRRKKHRSKRILQEYASLLGSETSDEGRQPVLVREEVNEVLKAIETCLSKQESQAVLLRYRDMADNEQAAQKMNVAKGTFLRYVSLGMKRIRAIVRSGQADD
ncbi:MAG: sigma-70 family RNA polymerase sigma factor [Planctomycetaceae bacterium]|nr:sigma-70 family RNA polymerase sigma factor [Planctomycetaceae bacterium]